MKNYFWSLAVSLASVLALASCDVVDAGASGSKSDKPLVSGCSTANIKGTAVSLNPYFDDLAWRQIIDFYEFRSSATPTQFNKFTGLFSFESDRVDLVVLNAKGECAYAATFEKTRGNDMREVKPNFYIYPWRFSPGGYSNGRSFLSDRAEAFISQARQDDQFGSEFGQFAVVIQTDNYVVSNNSGGTLEKVVFLFGGVFVFGNINAVFAH